MVGKYGLFLLVLALSGAPGPAVAVGGLLTELGCGQCHTGVVAQPSWLGKLPRIDAMGSRYQSAYLVKYLEAPSAVRPLVRPARMPTFPMSQVERSALVAELIGKRKRSDDDRGIKETVIAPQYGDAGAIARGDQLFNEVYNCSACHGARARGEAIGPSLGDVHRKLNPDWVQAMLVDPARYIGHPIMPNQLFKREPSGQYVGLMAGRDARQDLADLMVYLFRKGQPSTPSMPVGGEQTASLVESFGCGQCHNGGGAPNAPSMARVGRALTPDYLSAYLAAPTPVRPFGYLPGDGGRMPNFRLTKDEVAKLSTEIRRLGEDYALPAKATKITTLSPFKQRKAERFVKEKLSCLGCHSHQGEGGRVAPDLAMAGRRLNPDYIRSAVFHPQEVHPGVSMPKVRFRPTPATGELVYAWLLGQEDAADTTYLSPLTAQVLRPVPDAGVRQDYGKYCAMCHGAEGRGDGFNAEYLPKKPTAHTDAAYFSGRPDDTLFDGIYVGGFVLNRSHRMPGWGGSLSRERIRALVAHVRTLCNCSQPEWAGDGR